MWKGWMLPQDDEMAAIDVWMQYSLSTLEKEFGSHNNESHAQRLKYIPGNRRSSDILHCHAHQGRGFVRHKRLCKGSKSEVDCSTSVRAKIN